MALPGLLIVGIGIFSLLGGIMQWSFFMNHRKAQFFIRLFGHQGTRIFYGVLGVSLMVFGGLMALNVFGLPVEP
ncbi:MAG: immunity 17 family protein [Myxococcota bacterium]